MNRFLVRQTVGQSLSKLSPHLRFTRADLFAFETGQTMEERAMRQTGEQWNALPAHVSPRNRIDLWGVRSRLPNFFGLEQAFLDQECLAIMPFAQPSVLRTLFRVPEHVRRGGRLYRSLIRRRRPALRNYPLVKGTVRYPYRLHAAGATLYTKALQRMEYAYRNSRTASFLRVMQPFVMDTLRSAAVRQYAAYDIAKIDALVRGYCNGAQHLAQSLDWWPTFKMWRQTLNGEVQAAAA